MLAALGAAGAILAAGTARATEPTAAERCWPYSDRQHTVGAVLDLVGPAQVGARYLHVHRSGDCGHFFFVGYGLDLRTARFDAALAHALVTLGGEGHVLPGGALELGLGGGKDSERWLGTGMIGLFASLLHFLEVGAVAHFPIGVERPVWLGDVQLGIRLDLPVYSYGEYRAEKAR